MNSRENYLKVLHGDIPEWIPLYKQECDIVVPLPYKQSMMASFTDRDFFGVRYKQTDHERTVDTTVKPALDDIADWRSVVKPVDLDTVDWEQAARIDLADHDPDKILCAFVCMADAGTLFLPVMGMMGFEEGLIALIEDPESVHEFFEYMTSYYEKLIDYEEKYYNPDMYAFMDDLSSHTGPMISWDTYTELFRPYYKRIIDKIKSYGKIVEFHICGYCEDIVCDLAGLGVDVWQPAQSMNDICMLKDKNQGLVINGGWSTKETRFDENSTEEEVRQIVRDTFDKYAQNGRYIFFPGVMGFSEQVVEWLYDEARNYGKTFYQG